MKTIVYIDALNLYHRCLKDTDYKWLDLESLFTSILKSHQINKIDKIKYFTANIKELQYNKGANLRQRMYLNALKTFHIIEIHKGDFSKKTKKMRRAIYPHKLVKVTAIEEKKSDVNFSVHLLNDAHNQQYDCAVIVTNDSDMTEALKLVKTQFPTKKLILITPMKKADHKSTSLKEYADIVIKSITLENLKNAQLPNPVIGNSNEKYSKPESWEASYQQNSFFNRLSVNWLNFLRRFHK